MNWIVYADEALVVVNKPAGLLSVPGRGADKADCASHRVQQVWPDALVVHRLDMATSGLLLMARGAQAQRVLSAAFERRQVHKRYVAVVTGEPDAGSGVIDLPLSADWPNRPRQQVDQARGRPSTTRWQVLCHEGAGRTRVLFEPVTGRSHQLRVHAAAMGWPIVGDRLYGRADGAAGTEPRLLLHASELAVEHPADGQVRTWASAPPF